MSFTVAELTEAITQLEEQIDFDGGDLFMSIWSETIEVLPTLEGIGQIEVADTRGGEGDGAAIYATIKIGDRYFERSGYYSSWGGDEMDSEIYEVKPVQVMRTEYERI